ncbi:MAG TPA: hypothetical protein VGF50_04470 [Caulobacteraceae bacterium]
MPEVEHSPPEDFRPRGPRPRDLVLPVCALFISVVSVVVAVIHGRAIDRMAEENARLVEANSWPFLQFVTGNQADNGALVISLGVHNAGVGPAKVESFEVSWKGQPVRNSVELLERCCGLDLAELEARRRAANANVDQQVAAAQRASRSSISSNGVSANPGATGVMEAHQQVNFLVLPLTPQTAPVWAKLNAARFQVQTRACYCSVFDECWLSDLHTLRPTAVKSCPAPKVPFGG